QTAAIPSGIARICNDAMGSKTRFDVPYRVEHCTRVFHPRTLLRLAMLPLRYKNLLMTLAWLAAACAHAFDLQGHRGARGLAPENTLPAFDVALDIGVNTLELDTVVTRDDVVVITHDPLLNPDLARDELGRWLRLPRPAVRNLTLEQI